MLSSPLVRFSGLFLLPLLAATAYGKPAAPPRASRAVVESKLRSAEPKRSPEAG